MSDWECNYFLGCKVTKADLMDLERLEQPFYFDMNVTDINKLYMELASREGATEDQIELGIEIPSRPKDWKTRYGIKGKPFTTVFETTRTISILHCSWLCMFKFLENAIVRLVGWMPAVGRGCYPPRSAFSSQRSREAVQEFTSQAGWLQGRKLRQSGHRY